MIELIEKIPTVEEYNELNNSVGWGKRNPEIIEEALKNSIYSICAYENQKLIGFARIIGDKTIYIYIQDVMVNPEYQKRGIGSKIIENILNKVEDLRKINPNIKVYLCASKNRESFYERFGFVSRPNDEMGAGMILKK